jgi:hypothetical protein
VVLEPLPGIANWDPAYVEPSARNENLARGKRPGGGMLSDRTWEPSVQRFGLNLHYLPPAYRAAFMDKLMQFAITNENDEPKRLRVTYDILASTRRYKEFRACVKHYLNSQIKSKILTIKPSEWETALFLPTSVFKGAPTKTVYKESIQKANARIY